MSCEKKYKHQVCYRNKQGEHTRIFVNNGELNNFLKFLRDKGWPIIILGPVSSN